MNKYFVDFELALRLKVLGFNEPCIACFDKRKALRIWVDYSDFEFLEGIPNSTFGKWGLIGAPLWDQVLDWIESKGVKIGVNPFTSKSFSFGIKDPRGLRIVDGRLIRVWRDSRLEAIQAAIECALIWLRNNG